MAEYWVAATGGSNSNAGTSANPWATLQHAADTAAAGDTIRLKAGTYNQVVRITKNSQTWTSDVTNTTATYAILDGNYGPDRITYDNKGQAQIVHPRILRKTETIRPDPGKGPGYISGGIITVANGVTGTKIQKLKIYNSAGAAINVGPTCHNTTIDGCIIDFSYAGSIGSNGANKNSLLNNLTIKNCRITRSSVRLFVPGKTRFCEGHQPDGQDCGGSFDFHITDPTTGRPYKPSGGSESVDVCIKPKYSDSAQITGNTIAYTYGEGIAAAAKADNILIENNVIHNTYHWALGVNCSQNATIKRNIVWTAGTLADIENSTAALAIGDEELLSGQCGQRSENVEIYNNLFVGYKKTVSIRGGKNYVTNMKDFYIGYNTIVGAVTPGLTELVIQIDKGKLDGDIVQNHRSALIENNVFIRNGATTIGSVSDGMSGIRMRNNMWSVQPVTALRGAGDVNGSSVANALVAAGTDLAPAAIGYTVKLTNAQLETLTTKFAATLYHIDASGSAIIGKGADHSPALGITPPVSPTGDAKDYLNNSRDNTSGYFDPGFHEFDGAAPGVTASFTQKDKDGNNATGGQVDYAVTFKDTSTVGAGVTVLQRDWDFNGDNVPDMIDAANEVTFIYQTPGSPITPYMKLKTSEGGGKWYTATGSAMTLTGNEGNSVVIDTISKDIGTSATNVDFTFTLGGLVPKLVVFTMTKAVSTDSGSPADDAMLSHGFASSSKNTVRQYAGAMISKDNQDPTKTGRRQVSDGVLLEIDETGAITGAARVPATGFAADKVTVTVTDAFSANYKVTATAYAGNGVEAIVGTGVGPAVGASVSIPTGFTPSLFCVATINRDMSTLTSGAGDTTGALSIGWATAANNQYYVRWHESNSWDTARPEVNIGTGIAYRAAGATGIVMRVAGFTPTGVSLQASDAYNVGFGWYALKLAKHIDLRMLSTSTEAASVGTPKDQDITLGWQPGHMQSILTSVAASAAATYNLTDTTRTASHIGLHVNQDAVGSQSAFERTNSIGSRHGAGAGGTTHTTSRIYNDKMTNPTSFTNGSSNDILTDLSASAEFLATGYRVKWTSTNTPARAWLVCAIETGTVTPPAGPVVSFTVTNATGGFPSGLPPVVAYLKDNSYAAAGAPITAWDIDWGDGIVETGLTSRPGSSSDKTHEYTVEGAYDVTVKATNSAGSNSRTITSAVVVQDRQPDQIIGPLRPDTITEDTENSVRLNIDDSQRGLITHRLDLGAVKFSRDYTNAGARELTVDANRWQLAVVNNELVVMTSTGIMGKVNVTWDETVEPPPPTEGGTLTAKIKTGNDDGRQLNDDSVELTVATNIAFTAATQWGAFRFQSVAIPRGAVIQSAKLRLYVTAVDADDINVDLYAHKTGSADPLDAANNGIQKLFDNSLVTTAKVTWQATSLGAGYKDSPDIKTVIQEVLNLAGWSSGNAITVLLDPLTGATGSPPCDINVRPFEYGDGSFAAELVITWTL